jgi:hypothetical protein
MHRATDHAHAEPDEHSLTIRPAGGRNAIPLRVVQPAAPRRQDHAARTGSPWQSEAVLADPPTWRRAPLVRAEATVVTAALLEDFFEQQSEASAQVATGLDVAVLQLAQLLQGLHGVLPQSARTAHIPNPDEG